MLTKKYGPVPVGEQGAEPDGFGEIEHSSNTSTEQQEQLAAELAAVRKRLKHQTEALEVIAQWKNELRIRLARAKLRFQLVGLDPAEQDLLAKEVHDFKSVCRFLARPT